MKYLVPLAVLMLMFTTACSDPEPAAEGQPAGQAEPSAQGGSEAAPEPQAAEPQEPEVEVVDEAMARAKAEMEEKAAAAQAALEAGEAYLHINAQKPTVTVLDSGLQYEVLKKGDGKTPGPTSSVVTHYHGTFPDGDVFDSSLERGSPAEFPVNRVIAGWTEALQLMKEGDTWRLVVPSHLGYGERGAGDVIPPNAVLIFEVELIEVKD